MKLIKIVSDHVQIKTNHKEFEEVKINDLISISDSKAELITIVTSISDSEQGGAVPTLEDDFLFETEHVKVIDCSIIGSVKNGKFSKAIETYPTTDIEAKEIDASGFKKLLSVDKKQGFEIGKYTEYGTPAWVDGNKFFQRHACIVGNTGSGKSETVAKILEETSKLPGANLIVFDIHGEYSQLSYARNIDIGDSVDFPAWMFGFSGFVSNILKVREESASVVMSALRKCYYSQCPDGKENKPIYWEYKKFVRQMERLNNQEVPTGEFYKTGDKAGMPKTTKGEFNGKLSSIINTLKDKMSDQRYSFLFSEKGQEYLMEMMHLIIDNDKPVKNIDLSKVPHDVAISVIGMITKLVYDIQKNQDREKLVPITLICDEAHVYIPNDIQLSASQKRMVEVFEEIAKEGRKFGITLFPASQRPSELNKTIMAQCANFIVGKLNNENDKSMIKGMLPDGNETLIDSTTTFAPGEVLVIGDAVPIPLRIKVTLATERPQSRTVEFWNEWKKESSVELEEAVKQFLEH